MSPSYNGMGDLTIDSRGAVAYSIGRTYNLLVRELSLIYKRFGLSASSFNLLMLVKHGRDPESMTQREVGKRLVVSPSDMTGLIDRLEKKGLLERAPGKDRRSNLLRITPRGAALLDQVWPDNVRSIERLTQRLAKGQAHAIVQGLAQLRSSVVG